MSRPAPHIPLILRFTRYGLPALIALTGVVIMDTNLALSVALVGVAAIVWLLSWFYRFGVTGDNARETEEQARIFFDEHGHWPD